MFCRFLRIVNITGKLFDGSNSITFNNDFEYSDVKGYLKRVGDFDIVKGFRNRLPLTSTSDLKFTIERVSG